MIQLTFQAALDPFHAMFRLLRLRELIATFDALSVDHVRILDFYLTFPFRVEAIRLRPDHRRYRKLSAAYAYARSYGEQPEDATLFERMGPMQIAAMETLASSGFYDVERLRASWLAPTSKRLPDQLAARVEQANGAEVDFLDFLRVLAAEYVVAGPNGLKHRSRLMEYRYDVA